MSSSASRVGVLTMSCGENELEMCRQSIASQVGVSVHHELISDLSNREAHEALYKLAESWSAEDIDVIVKVDADMVLARPTALADVVTEFSDRPRLAHAIFLLWDFYSCGLIWGLHAFRPGMRWPRLENGLFVDPDPVIDGERRLFPLWPSPFAFHSPDPTLRQAYEYGVHRAAKAFQFHQARLNIGQARRQWRQLRSTWQVFMETNDERRLFAVAGATDVWRGTVDPRGEYKGATIEQRFHEIQAIHPEQLAADLAKAWSPPQRIVHRAWALRTRRPLSAVVDYQLRAALPDTLRRQLKRRLGSRHEPTDAF